MSKGQDKDTRVFHSVGCDCGVCNGNGQVLIDGKPPIKPPLQPPAKGRFLPPPVLEVGFDLDDDEDNTLP